ncbi:putative armadillo-like helical protein [Helianthus annuus]|nr:putative armadillo-like helical protein [Helianthus annuus]
MKSLKRLKTIVLESDMNKRSVEAVGAAEYLADVITNPNSTNMTSSSAAGEFSDEAVSILYHLHMSQTGLKALFGRNGEFIEALTRTMQRTDNDESRTYAVLLLKSMMEVVEPVQVMVKTVEAGAVPVLVDIATRQYRKRIIEMVLMLLHQLCLCADGRAELLKHGAGLAVVSKKIFRVSAVASERAVRILHSIAKFSAMQVFYKRCCSWEWWETMLSVAGRLLWE